MFPAAMSVSSAGQQIIRSCRRVSLLTQGHISRTMSVNKTRALIGGSESHHGSPAANQQSPINKSLTITYDHVTSLEQSLSSLTLSPLELKLSLRPPTRKVVSPTQKMVSPTMMKEMLDPSPYNLKIIQKCPTRLVTPILYDPSPNETGRIQLPELPSATEKRASNIMEKRRRKMNRHRYLKWKKRNKFKLRILKQRRKKRKRARWERHLDKFRFKGLQPGEGEEYLAKKREKLNIYLRYLGISTEDESGVKEVEVKEQKVKGEISPRPIVPQGAKIG